MCALHGVTVPVHVPVQVQPDCAPQADGVEIDEHCVSVPLHGTDHEQPAVLSQRPDDV